ncbi:uncharacterized protein LDX57_005066 [Aspergillus melleus]|uniref:uncharacterized protein n=1 Tax=Aspergillus melleus TaxID=138277 RepID=UPI001E8DF464|nr:uncharacterized protein LDX57_005066 [Aspergillus melleus]KAH8427353.1 hypothetical protein LDX57_005066 [Aspergillus melleus]
MSNIRITRWSSTEEVVEAVREYKDTLNDPNAPDETREEARQMLDRLGADESPPDPDDRGKVTIKAAEELNLDQGLHEDDKDEARASQVDKPV